MKTKKKIVNPSKKDCKPTSKVKRIEGWMIVNKDFERIYETNHGLVIGTVYFMESQAKSHLDKMRSHWCEECGNKVKPQKLQVRIIPITIEINTNKK